MSVPNLPPFLIVRSDGVSIAIKVQPRASVNAIGEPIGNELRIRVTAPPVDSAANDALLRFLAEMLNCSRGNVHLVRGHNSRHKLVKVTGISPEVVMRKLGCA